MRINKETTSLVMFALGAVVTTAVIYLFSTINKSLVLDALNVPSNHGYELLQTSDSTGLAILGIAIGAGLALGLSGVGASLGMGTASAAALGAITEKPETFGKSILYVVFIEAVAIYGFVIAFLLVGYIPTVLAG
ncbi:V-type ATP synthase subunit K [Candidatus Thorarchaeota archaeon]|nr:MAG: V-type ATP synthase subunit K [Candidatus Thorarchaeota archaeon]